MSCVPVKHLTSNVTVTSCSAGFGSRTAELEEFIHAEEVGRQEGGCEDLYPACPYRLLDMVQSAFSYLHHGLANVGGASADTLFS